ncbi:MAG: hypothetical protein AAF696_08935, partial [Bacteroidota bacterium]
MKSLFIRNLLLIFFLFSSPAITVLLAQEDGRLIPSVKAYIAEFQSQSGLNEKAIFLKSSIAQAVSPQKQILQSILAEYYYTYYLANLEALASQPLLEEEEDKIETWSRKKLIETTAKLYQLSLKKSNELKIFPSEQIYLAEVATKHPEFRPSLFDILAHRALDFYSDPRTTLYPAPAGFKMRAQGLIMSPEKFSLTSFPELDSLNHIFISLTIYQKLLAYQLDKKVYNALIDTHLRMIKWLRTYSSGLDKAGRYVKNLLYLIANFPNNHAIADVKYELAMVYVGIAGDFQPLGGNAYKWDYQKAHEICEGSIAEYPDSRGAEKCKALIQLIEKPALRIAAEAINLPMKPFRMQLAYRNMDHLYYRLYRIPLTQKKNFENLRSAVDKWAFVKKLGLHKKGDTYLAFDGDHQFHRTETSIAGVEAGFYALCASNTKDFDYERGLIAILPIQISRLGTFSLHTAEELIYGVKDRESGKKLPKVEVSYLDGNESQQVFTDSLGQVSFQKQKYQSNRIDINLILEGDTLTEKLQLPFQEPRLFQAKLKTYLFSDRPSYYKGEHISLKGLIYRESDKAGISDTSLNIIVSKEGNYLDTLIVQTRQNGSFELSYPLPLNLQSGKLYLLCGAAYVGVDILDKKSSLFNISMRQDRSGYQANDSIQIYGQIYGPPNSNWEDADLRYLVTRDVRFPDWMDYFWWKPIPKHQEVLVKQGKSFIDSTGRFQLAFHSRTDPAHLSSQRPLYFYKVRVSATDPEGDKLNKTYNLLINESQRALDIEAPKEHKAEESLQVKLNSKNLQGKHEAFKARLSIELLEEPSIIYRRRKWLIPDLHLVSEAEYRRDFPKDVYGFEDDFRSWAIKDTLFEDSIFSDSGEELLEIDTKDWPGGMYRIRMLLPFGKKKQLQKRHYFRLNRKQEPLNSSEYLSLQLKQTYYKVGDTLEVELHSKLADLGIIYQLSKGNRRIESRNLNVSGGISVCKLPLKEAHIGTLEISASYVQDNEANRLSQLVKVMGSSPEFEIYSSPSGEKIIQFQEDFNGKLLHFHSRVAADVPKSANFSFGIPRAVKEKLALSRTTNLEAARAALAYGKSWTQPILFPSYQYASLIKNSPIGPSVEEEFFRQTANNVLRFPTNRRSLPPKHRWINLLANVAQNRNQKPSWAFEKWEKAWAWKQKPAFSLQEIAERKAYILAEDKPLIPGKYIYKSLIRDDKASFAYREYNEK